MENVKRIYFEDHGQDFLWWDMDGDGNVIDCGPFQASIWTKAKVLNVDVLVGEKLIITTPSIPDELSINYTIEKIEIKQKDNGYNNKRRAI